MAAKFQAIRQSLMEKYSQHLPWPIWGAFRPRTAYQRYHELQYEQFGSAQGLMNAMRDYQRMAPQKLNDEVLELILWNKTLIILQQELANGISQASDLSISVTSVLQLKQRKWTIFSGTT